jgi:hypothetical protein
MSTYPVHVQNIKQKQSLHILPHQSICPLIGKIQEELGYVIGEVQIDDNCVGVTRKMVDLKMKNRICQKRENV